VARGFHGNNQLARLVHTFRQNTDLRQTNNTDSQTHSFFSTCSLLCAAVDFDFILILINFDFIQCNSNFDFILYYNLLLCLIPLEMHVRLTRAIKFYLLTYLLNAFSALTLLVGRQEGHPARKN